MDVIKAIIERYSARDFKSDAVPKETLVKILEAALTALPLAIVSPGRFLWAVGR